MGAGAGATSTSTSSSTSTPRRVVTLTGENLTAPQLMSCTSDVLVELAPSAWDRIRAGRKALLQAVASNETVYGVNTGFGSLANTVIAPDKVAQLQVNLIRSHAAGAPIVCPDGCPPPPPPHSHLVLCLLFHTPQALALHSPKPVFGVCWCFASMSWPRDTPASPRATWSACWLA